MYKSTQQALEFKIFQAKFKRIFPYIPKFSDSARFDESHCAFRFLIF